MKNLLEIAGILTRKKVGSIEILDASAPEDKRSKFGEFYTALLEGRVHSDKEAAELLYGSLPTDDRYRQLKSRFRKRLLNTLFFIDVTQPGIGRFDSAYHTCQKEWALLQILRANGAEQAAYQLARQVLQTALRHGFTDLVVGAARVLRQFAASAGQEAAFREYDAVLRQHGTRLQAEMAAEEACQRVRMMHRSSDQTTDSGQAAAMDPHCQALDRLSDTFDVPAIHLHRFEAWVIRHEMEGDFDAMLRACNDALRLAHAHPDFLTAERQHPFLLKRMLAALHLGDFQSAGRFAESDLDRLVPGSEAWFRYLEWYLLLALRTGQFVDGLAILDQAAAHPAFRKLDAVEKTKWQTFEIYLRYFLLEGDFPDTLKARVLKSFRLSRFLEEPIVLPRAMRLLLVHQVIAQVLFLMDRGMLAEAAVQVERLRSMAVRKLDRDRHAALVEFIRLLVILGKAGFSPAFLPPSARQWDAAPVKGASYYNGSSLDSLEIVPYDRLWRHVLDKLAASDRV